MAKGLSVFLIMRDPAIFFSFLIVERIETASV